MKKTFFNKIIVGFILVMIIFTGLLLRLDKAGTYPLWSDEAETVINSRQILNGELPNGYYKGEPLFENFIGIPAPLSDSKYAYVDKNYLGSKYENNKGWLTYYLLAGWMKLTGFSTFNVRLLFIIISTFSIIILFLIARELYGQIVGLTASFLYAINPALVEYGRMCRYYSLMVLFVLLSLYFYIKLSQRKQRGYYYLLTVCLILLFHIHIISFFAITLYFLIDWFFIQRERFNKHLLINLVIFLLFTIPWLVLVKFWVNVPLHNSWWWKILWLLCCFLIIFAIYFLNSVINLIRGTHKEVNLRCFSFLETFILIYIFFSLLLIPAESLHHRLLLPVFTLLNILFIVYFKKAFLEKRRKFLIIFIILLIINSFLVWVVRVGYQPLYRSEWVGQIIDYLARKDLPDNAPIYLRNYYQSLSVYIPNKVILIDALRQEFLDKTKEEFYFFIKRNDFCALANQQKCKVEDSPYRNIIKICPFEQINDDLGVFHCSSKQI